MRTVRRGSVTSCSWVWALVEIKQHESAGQEGKAASQLLEDPPEEPAVTETAVFLLLLFQSKSVLSYCIQQLLTYELN